MKGPPVYIAQKIKNLQKYIHSKALGGRVGKFSDRLAKNQKEKGKKNRKPCYSCAKVRKNDPQFLANPISAEEKRNR